MSDPTTDELLSDRQKELVTDLIELTDKFGKFGPGIDSEGSHYTPAANNPFKAEGLVCANCAFYSTSSNACAIVEGVIEPEAICKFWVIENAELENPSTNVADSELDTEDVALAARYSNIDFSPPAGVKAAAKRGLALHEKGLSGDGLESATVLWARKYTQGKPVSPERARMGNRFYGRNARFANAPKDSPAWVSWLLWGGSAGKAWFSKLVKQMDAADKKSSASVNGGIYLTDGTELNPFLKEIHLILTDFEPNANNEAISRAEADNIIKTSRLTPIKIASDGNSYAGHAGAHPVGAIIDSFLDTHNGKDVIKSRAFIWKDEYPAIYDLLKSQASEGNFIGTSWEVYYTHANEEQGVRWLNNVTFAGTCIVDNPAYGDRTPLLSVAEQTMYDFNTLKEKFNELDALFSKYKSSTNFKKEVAEITMNETENTSSIVGILTQLLAQTVHLYYKAHASHWNVVSQDFPQYHEFFGDLYEIFFDEIDPTAEFIRALNVKVIPTLQGLSSAMPADNASADGTIPEMLQGLYNDMELMLSTIGQGIAATSTIQEFGIQNYLQDRMSQTQKYLWQIRSALQPEQENETQPVQFTNPLNSMSTSRSAKNRKIELLEKQLSEQQGELDGLRKENDALKTQANAQAAAEKRQNVTNQLLSVGFTQTDLAEKLDFYLSLEDSIFQQVFSDIAKNSKTVAERKDTILVPEPSTVVDSFRDPKKIASEFKKIIRGEI